MGSFSPAPWTVEPLSNDNGMRVEISSDTLYIRGGVHGTDRLTVESPFIRKVIVHHGPGILQSRMFFDSLELEFNGFGNLRMIGSATQLFLSQSGANYFDLSQFRCSNIEGKMGGYGILSASDSLKIEGTGAAKLIIKRPIKPPGQGIQGNSVHSLDVLPCASPGSRHWITQNHFGKNGFNVFKCPCRNPSR